MGGSPPVLGFWGAPTSTVDWCEANYAHSAYIAECFNTLSSLAIVATGLLGLWLHRRLLEARFLLCFASVALVGLGSIAFHATLRFELQMADELPMLYSAIIMVYILLENRPERRFGAWFPLALAAHAALVTALSRGPLQFYLFHLSFGSLETFSLVGVYLLQRRHGTVAARRLFRTGIAAYLLAVALWFIDPPSEIFPRSSAKIARTSSRSGGSLGVAVFRAREVRARRVLAAGTYE
jgi:dihydroceramidase